jgi:hypothetical protein
MDDIQNGPLPFLKKVEIIINSEALSTKFFKNLISFLISLKTLK